MSIKIKNTFIFTSIGTLLLFFIIPLLFSEIWKVMMNLVIEERISIILMINLSIIGFLSLISYTYGETFLLSIIIPIISKFNLKYKFYIISLQEKIKKEIPYFSPLEIKLEKLKIKLRHLKKDEKILKKTGNPKNATIQRRTELQNEISHIKENLNKFEKEKIPQVITNIPKTSDVIRYAERAWDAPELSDAIVSIYKMFDRIELIRNKEIDNNVRTSLIDHINEYYKSVRKIRQSLSDLEAKYSRRIRTLLEEIRKFEDPLKDLENELSEASKIETILNNLMSLKTPTVLSIVETKNKIDEINKEISILEKQNKYEYDLFLIRATSIEARKHGRPSPLDDINNAYSFATGTVSLIFIILFIISVYGFINIFQISINIPYSPYSSVGLTVILLLVMILLLLLFSKATIKIYKEYYENVWMLLPSSESESDYQTFDVKKAEIQAYKSQKEYWDNLPSRREAARKEKEAWESKKKYYDKKK